MKEKALEILLRYIDNTKEANDALSELLVLFDVMLVRWQVCRAVLFY